MKRQFNHQRGQALILIALGLVGMIGLTALAIDGGNAFSQRRHAQNAADTASLAGALEKVRDFNGEDVGGVKLKAAAFAIAKNNGYNPATNPNISVVVNNPPLADCKGSITGPYYNKINYVQVIIREDVDTYFGSVVGIPQTHSCVEAIALAQPAYPPFGGAAIIALECHAKWAIEASGTTNIEVRGGGLYSNSDHAEPIKILKPENLVLQPGYAANMVGDGLSASSCTGAIPPGYPFVCNIPQKTPCPPLPDDDPLLPQYICDYYYPGDYKPPDGEIIDQGVHCIEGNFYEANFTSELSDPINPDPNKIGGVTFVMLNKGIQWSGNNVIRLNAPSKGSTKGLLFYLPPSNASAVTMNGTANTTYIGSILAPSSEITLNGTLDGDAFHSSVIGRTIKLTGTGFFNVYYDSEKNYWFPPQIELTK
jgi:hypothetical protein